MRNTKSETKKTTKSNKLVCSNCIESFDAKSVAIAQVPDREYSTVYCLNCIKKLKIDDFKLYQKPRQKKIKT
jgi:ribosomal protein L34E